MKVEASDALPAGFAEGSLGDDRCVDVAIIGGGFAGSVVAVQLARQPARARSIALFDRAGAFGRGVAYSTASDGFLLNVPARAMSAFPDAEDDFVRWLRAYDDAFARDDDVGDRFLPRRLYGAYVQSLLAAPQPNGSRIACRTAAVVELDPLDDGYRVRTQAGEVVFARSVVVAIGNLPPGGLGDPQLDAAMARLARNPWSLAAGERLDPDADVLIVGTGLTALDVLVHTSANGHGGRITMLSRHARFPLPHVPRSHRPPPALEPLAGKPRDVLRTVRRTAARVEGDGGRWQDVVDALRPQLNAVWQRWSLDERRQFFRHLASMWDVHRHRAPHQMLALRDDYIAAARLTVLRGRLTRVESAGARIAVSYRPRGGDTDAHLVADAVVDCTGSRRELTRSGDPFVNSLMQAGLARPGPLGLGFALAGDGTLARTSAGGPPLYVLGPPLRGALTESSAVREVREQACQIAAAIVARDVPAHQGHGR